MIPTCVMPGEHQCCDEDLVIGKAFFWEGLFFNISQKLVVPNFPQPLPQEAAIQGARFLHQHAQFALARPRDAEGKPRESWRVLPSPFGDGSTPSRVKLLQEASALLQRRSEFAARS